MLRGARAWYQGFPGLMYYSGYYNWKPVPSAETLQKDVEKLDRYVATKQHELKHIADEKKELAERNALGPSPTLRMVFRRAEIELNHDVKELKSEREMVVNALLELPRYWNRNRPPNEKEDGKEEQRQQHQEEQRRIAS